MAETPETPDPKKLHDEFLEAGKKSMEAAGIFSAADIGDVVPVICDDQVEPVELLVAPTTYVVGKDQMCFHFPVKGAEGIYIRKFISGGSFKTSPQISKNFYRKVVAENGDISWALVFTKEHSTGAHVFELDPLRSALRKPDLSASFAAVLTSETPDKAFKDMFARLEVALKIFDGKTWPRSQQEHADKAFVRAVLGHFDETMVNMFLVEADRSRGEEWLNVMSRLPFGPADRAPVDIPAFRALLEERHYGMADVKRALIEEAVFTSSGLRSDVTLCLVGSPGVGKTSIAESFAKATGRPVFTINMAGVGVDPATITGHNRSWNGAAPGSIINAIMQAGVTDPIIIFDEIDKIGERGGTRGDAAATLLGILDPAQKASYRDNYLAVKYDISKVTFIATANYIDRIPPELTDRLRIVNVPSCSPREKVQIGMRHILPKLAAGAGMAVEETGISEEMVSEIVTRHTHEAGCRSLAKHLERLVRDLKVRKLEAGAETTVDPDISKLLGRGISPPQTEAAIGRINGLYASAMGGGLIPIEAVILTRRHPSYNEASRTGNMKEVMSESTMVARTAAHAWAMKSGGPRDYGGILDAHIHALSAATPKEGPSAGLAITLALLSAWEKRAPASGIAITGEISLMGKVRPVGGIRDKVFGALAAGIGHVIMPVENRHEFEEIPEEDRAGLKASFVSCLEEAYEIVLGQGAVQLREAG